MKLLHKKSNTIWEFVREIDRQFTGKVVVLRNIKTGKEETFFANTYKLFFKQI